MTGWKRLWTIFATTNVPLYVNTRAVVTDEEKDKTAILNGMESKSKSDGERDLSSHERHEFEIAIKQKRRCCGRLSARRVGGASP